MIAARLRILNKWNQRIHFLRNTTLFTCNHNNVKSMRVSSYETHCTGRYRSSSFDCLSNNWDQKNNDQKNRYSCHNHLKVSSFSTSKNANNDNDNDDPNQSYNLTLKQRKALKLLREQFQPSSSSSSSSSSQETIHSQTDLSQILTTLRQQSEKQDLEHYQSNPQPWYYLLTYPSRALWRSSPKLPPSYLTTVQSNLLHKKISGRTSKQLRRTMENIVNNHLELSQKREKQRRDIVNNNHNNGNSTTNVLPSSSKAKQEKSMEKKIKPVYYKPEQTLCSLKYRLVPNYNITKRILRETQGLVGKEMFQPKRVLDVGIGIGSSSAAVLDYAYERFVNENNKRSSNRNNRDDPNENDGNNVSVDKYNGIEWIHGIDPSLSMRDGAERILNSVVKGQQEELFQSMGQNDNNNNKRIIQHPRITLGEALSSSPSIGRDISKSKGSFDLALCTYTLCEIPHVAASLALVISIWEKLSPNGIAIFIEPGTPDGFNSLRSVRSALLDCCPPSNGKSGDNEDSSIAGDEECHVIAPCTHNGTCPMVRHQQYFFKDKEAKNNIDEMEDDSLSDKYNEDEMEDDSLNDEYNEDFEGMMDEDDDIDDGWEDNDDDDDDDDDDIDFDFDSDDGWEDDDEWDENEINEDTWGSTMTDQDHKPLLSSKSKKSSDKKSMANETDVFNTSFCSFVHGMPGGEHGKRGEKFTYLVLQKRLTEDRSNMKQHQEDNQNDIFHNIDVVKLLSQSMDESGVHFKPTSTSSKAQHQYPKAKDNPNVQDLLSEAVKIERIFINSDEDKLGLELVKGKLNSWGRIIRAPIKKKGHVVVDYCTSSLDHSTRDDEGSRIMLMSEDDQLQTLERGKIIRQKVTRRQSERAAPGMYLASRKSRWGGLWPDVEKSK